MIRRYSSPCFNLFTPPDLPPELKSAFLRDIHERNLNYLFSTIAHMIAKGEIGVPLTLVLVLRQEHTDYQYIASIVQPDDLAVHVEFDETKWKSAWRGYVDVSG